MDIEQDLKRIAEQEEVFQFERFDALIAWEIGGYIKAAAEKRGVAIMFDFTVNGMCVNFFAMPGTTLDHIDWVRRKRNVANRYQRPSYVVGLWLARDKTTIEASQGASTAEYAPHGGSFPIRVKGVGCIGAITVSGVQQRDDHGILIEGLAAYFKKPLAGLALD